tara:strand:- start:697 stop:1800 length:1104 start_codon:yes stop_codon:yes gene_type:complete
MIGNIEETTGDLDNAGDGVADESGDLEGVGLALALAVDYAAEPDNGFGFITSGDVVLIAEDLTGDTCSPAAFVEDDNDLKEALAALRAAFRSIDAPKRQGAKSKDGAAILPRGAAAGRMVGSLLGYVEGVSIELPKTGKNAPAELGTIRSGVRLLRVWTGADTVCENDKALAADEATIKIADATGALLPVYRPVAIAQEPVIAVKALEAAMSCYTFNRSKPKLGSIGRLAVLPSGNGWRTGMVVTLHEAIMAIVRVGSATSSKWGSTVGDSQRPLLIVPVAPADYGVRKKVGSVVKAHLGKLSIDAAIIANGGKLTSTRQLGVFAHTGAAASATLRRNGDEDEATASEILGAHYGGDASFADWGMKD